MKSSPQEIEMKTMKEQIIIMKDRDPRVNILSDKLSQRRDQN